MMGKKPIIALDAGHGMTTPGKRCMRALDPNETREWWLNDRIMDQVEGQLRAIYNCTVLRVDDTTGGKDISMAKRVSAANAANADVYLSMHHNAGLSGRKGGGTVVFYCSSKPERPAQARKLYDAIVSRTGLKGNRSQQVINKGFYVIKNTKMPAFLVENGFMDSPTDVPVILSEQHAKKTVAGVVAFLEELLNLQTRQSADSGSNTGGGSGATEKPPQSSAAQGADNAYYPAYTGKKTTLSAAMASLGLNSTYAYRKKIAAVNNIKGYIGTAAQNTRMYNMLVAGILKRV